MSAGITISSKDQVIEQVSTRLKNRWNDWMVSPFEISGADNGVEPASKAWEAFILPMNYVRMPYGCCTSRDEHAQPNEARIVILARHLPTRVE